MSSETNTTKNNTIKPNIYPNTGIKQSKNLSKSNFKWGPKMKRIVTMWNNSTISKDVSKYPNY